MDVPTNLQAVGKYRRRLRHLDLFSRPVPHRGRVRGHESCQQQARVCRPRVPTTRLQQYSVDTTVSLHVHAWSCNVSTNKQYMHAPHTGGTDMVCGNSDCFFLGRVARPVRGASWSESDRSGAMGLCARPTAIYRAARGQCQPFEPIEGFGCRKCLVCEAHGCECPPSC